MPQHLICLATVIYDVLFIIILVANYHLFSDINISQGSVATRLSVVESVDITLLQICR